MRKSKKFGDVAAGIRDLIAGMGLKDGDALPPEKQLATKFQASHLTVRKALRLLEAESLICKIPCRGNYVGAHPAPRFNTSNLVGVLLSDGDEEFYHRLIDLFESAMSFSGFHPVLHITRRSPEKERQILGFLRSIRVSGLIAVPNSALADDYNRLKIPAVFVDNFIPGVPIPHVITDDLDGSRQVMEHLIRHGHRRIAHIGGEAERTGELRLRGYRETLQKHDLPAPAEYIKTKLWQRDWGYHAMRELCRMPRPPTAVFCANDTLASGALRHLRMAGLDCPGKISLAGFGNTESAHDMQLTSVEQHCDQIAKASWNILRLAMAGQSHARNCVIPADLHIRESTGRVKR